MSFLYLTDIPLFSALTPQETALLQRSVARQTFPTHCIIQLEGQLATVFAVLTRGRAKAVLLREDGREIFLHFYMPGDFFGEMNLSEITTWPYTIMSVETSECLFVARDTMITLVKQNGEFAFRFLSFVSHRLHRTQNKLRQIIYQRGEGKILGYFEDLAKQVGTAVDGGTWIPEKISHQVIADTCGLTRETVTRLLRQLHKEGALHQKTDGWLLFQQR